MHYTQPEHLSHAMHYSPLTAAVWHTPVFPRNLDGSPEAGVLSCRLATLQVDVVSTKVLRLASIIQEPWKNVHNYTTHVQKRFIPFFSITSVVESGLHLCE